MTLIELHDGDNRPLGTLQANALQVVAEAEQLARDKGHAKRSCFAVVLRQHIENAGWQIEECEVEAGVAQLHAVRRGQTSTSVTLKVKQGGRTRRAQFQGVETMTNKHANAQVIPFFERERVYPDADALAWYNRLVGLDEHKRRLLIELELLLYPERLADWSRRHHGSHLRLCDLLTTRGPNRSYWKEECGVR